MNEQPWYQRPTISLELFLVAASIGWGVYVLTWFNPSLQVRGLPDGKNWDITSLWAVGAIVVGVGKLFFIKHPTAWVALAGMALWTGLSVVCGMSNPHSLLLYVHAALASANLGLILYLHWSFVTRVAQAAVLAAQDVRAAKDGAGDA